MGNVKLAERRFYPFVVYGLCLLMIFFCLGFFSSCRSIFLVPITEALDITRGAFSVSDSIRFLTSAVMNFFFGFFVNKFGTKKLICAGMLSIIICVLLYATSNTVGGFYIAGFFLGLGYTWTTTTMVGCVVNKWCNKNVGSVMGIILASNGIGGAVSTQIYTPIIYRHIFGYRNAFFITAILLVILVVLIIAFYREKPQSAPYSSKEKPKKSVAWEGITVKDAVKKPYFYMLLICVFLSGVVLQGITSPFSAHLTDRGIDKEIVAIVISCHAIFLALSKVVSGFVYDKFGLRANVLLCSASGLIALCAFASVSPSTFGIIMAFTAAFTFAMALPLETVMLPIFAGDLFGKKDYNVILGVVVSVGSVGFATGIPLMNFIYDVFGSYDYGIMFSFAALILFAVAMNIIISSSNKLKKEISQ